MSKAKLKKICDELAGGGAALKEVDLVCCDLTDEDVLELLRALLVSKGAPLRVLISHNKGITAASGAALAAAVSAGRVASLDVSDCEVGDAGGAALVRAAAASPVPLELLDLSRNAAVGAETARAVGQGGGLDVLRLDWTAVRAADVAAMCANAERFPRELSLNGCDVGDDGARALAGASGAWRDATRTLRLAYCRLPPSAAIVLGRALQTAAAAAAQSSLAHIYFDQNVVGDDGFRALLAAAAPLALKTLSVAGCGVTDAGAAALADAARADADALPETLVLAENALTAAGAAHVAAAVGASRRLRSLDVSANALGDGGARALAAAIADAGAGVALRRLNLWFNKLTPAGVAALGDAFKHNEALELVQLREAAHADIADLKRRRQAARRHTSNAPAAAAAASNAPSPASEPAPPPVPAAAASSAPSAVPHQQQQQRVEQQQQHRVSAPPHALSLAAALPSPPSTRSHPLSASAPHPASPPHSPTSRDAATAFSAAAAVAAAPHTKAVWYFNGSRGDVEDALQRLATPGAFFCRPSSTPRAVALSRTVSVDAAGQARVEHLLLEESRTVAGHYSCAAPFGKFRGPTVEAVLRQMGDMLVWPKI